MLDKIVELSDVVVHALRNGNKIMFCGNGGSAADAQHLAGEFINRFRFDRAPLAGLALTTDTSILTCIGNDSSFDHVFSKQILGLGNKGDVLIAISTSGNSMNILEACHACKEKGIYIVGFTGESGGKMQEIVDLLIDIPSKDTPRIQEGHITVGHIMCDIVEQEMFSK
jgi:D-sedoheptulose 7-phosphate isomerase